MSSKRKGQYFVDLPHSLIMRLHQQELRRPSNDDLGDGDRSMKTVETGEHLEVATLKLSSSYLLSLSYKRMMNLYELHGKIIEQTQEPKKDTSAAASFVLHQGTLLALTSLFSMDCLREKNGGRKW